MPRREPAGFTLIEVLMVVAIIATMAAVALPAIARFLRNYQIRGAAQQVAAEIQTARLQAIKRNVNFGVVFLVRSATSYQYFFEDKALTGARQTYATGDQGLLRNLPTGVQFDTPATTPNDQGFRLTRIGTMCIPTTGSTTTPCPDLSVDSISPAGPNFVHFDTTKGEATLTLRQAETGLTQQISVQLGGRIRVP